jgi:DNA-binding IclR family transcriptional regulator
MALFEDHLQGLGIQPTYRTGRVLAAIAKHPGASNREVADAAGVLDEGQISRLLKRLEHLGLVENTGEGHTKGKTNAWWLTTKGSALQSGVGGMRGDERVRG